MAYYTVAHLLQGSLDGRTPGPAGVKPEQCTSGFWDCVLLGKPYDAALGVPEEIVARLRREFAFWYPLDCRVSGKDLIPNHLTMSLYNHAAIWEDPAMWPRSIFCNGFVQVDAEKMSKSKGNFITLVDAISTWGADATRFACADAGDGIVNANFDRVVADKAILNLTTELEWITSTLAGKGKDTQLRAASAPKEWLDDWFANEMARLIKLAEEAYTQMRFREALKLSWYELQNARNRYRTGIEQAGADETLLRQWAEWQALLMVPITPHWSEKVWHVLGKQGCAVRARWPRPTHIERPSVTAAGQCVAQPQTSLWQGPLRMPDHPACRRPAMSTRASQVLVRCRAHAQHRRGAPQLLAADAARSAVSPRLPRRRTATRRKGKAPPHPWRSPTGSTCLWR